MPSGTPAGAEKPAPSTNRRQVRRFTFFVFRWLWGDNAVVELYRPSGTRWCRPRCCTSPLPPASSPSSAIPCSTAGTVPGALGCPSSCLAACPFAHPSAAGRDRQLSPLRPTVSSSKPDAAASDVATIEPALGRPFQPLSPRGGERLHSYSPDVPFHSAGTALPSEPDELAVSFGLRNSSANFCKAIES